MKNKKLIALISAASMTGSFAIPAVVSAADPLPAADDMYVGDAIWTEDFDNNNPTTGSDLPTSTETRGAKGWSYRYADIEYTSNFVGAPEQGVVIGSNNVLNVRMAPWWCGEGLDLDFAANAQERGITYSLPENAVLSADVAFTQCGNLQGGTTFRYTVMNADGNELVKLEAYYDSGNAELRAIINGTTTVLVPSTSDLTAIYNRAYDLKIYKSGGSDGGSILVKVDDQAIKAADGSEWYTVSSDVNFTKAEMEVWNSGYYEGLIVDNISVSPWDKKIHEDAPSLISGESFWTEDFDSENSTTIAGEDADKVDDLASGNKGWSVTGDVDYISNYIGSGASGDVGGYASFGNGNVLNIRVAPWFKAQKAVLDMKTNAEARAMKWNDSDKAVFNADFMFTLYQGNLQDGTDYRFKVMNSSGYELAVVAAHAAGGKVNLTITIAGAATTLKGYSDLTEVMGVSHNLKVYKDGSAAGGKLLVVLDGNIITAANGGNWHNVTADVNPAKIELEEYWAGYYDGIAVDNLSAAPWYERVESVDTNPVTEDANENGIYGDYNYSAAFMTKNIEISKISGNKYTWVVIRNGEKYAKEYTGPTIEGDGAVIIGLIVSNLENVSSEMSARLYLGALEDAKHTINID